MKRFAPAVIALGFAAFAAFTPAAFAAVFHAQERKYPVEVRGEGPGGNSKITTDDTSIWCGATWFGPVDLTEDTSQLNVLPQYENCRWDVEFAAYIYPEGCNVRFSVGEEIEKGVFTGTMGIVPPKFEYEGCPNNEIHVERSSCRWSFPVQEGHPTVEYTNSESETGVKTITAKLAVTGLEYSLSGFGCFTGEYADGKWHETITFSAYKEEKPVGIEIE
jgi:hypothetical protein